MTDQPVTVSRLREGSILVILLSAVGTVVVTILSTALPHPGAVAASKDEMIWSVVWAASWALGGTILSSIPAAIAYRRRVRRRDPVAEQLRLENGVVSRPVGLIVVLSGAGITLVTIIIFTLVTALATIPMLSAYSQSAHPDVGWGIAVILIGFLGVSPLGTVLLINRLFRRIGHYLGRHPFRATAIAVGLSFVELSFVVLVVELNSRSGSTDPGTTALGLIIGLIVLEGFIMLSAQLGTRFAQLRQSSFVVAKLAIRETPPDHALRRLNPGARRYRRARRPPPDPARAFFAPPDPAQRRLD